MDKWLTTSHLPRWVSSMGLAVLFILCFQQFPFFWDAVVVASQAATYFYEQGWKGLILPEEINTGHPPFFAAYLCLGWLWFGKTTAISHALMLPWVMLLIFSLQDLLSLLKLGRWFPLLLVLSFGPLLGQLSMLGPELILVASYLMAISSFEKALSDKKQPPYLLIGLLLSLGILVGSRGVFNVMAFSAYLLWRIVILPKLFNPSRGFREAFFDKPSLKTQLRDFVWAGIKTLSLPVLVFFTWSAYHYMKVGWFGYNPTSQWAENYQPVGGIGFLKNMAILVWRLLDHGLGFVLLMGLYLGLKLWPRIEPSTKGKVLAFVGAAVFQAMALGLVMGWYANPIGHRYVLPAQLLLLVVCLFLLKQLPLSRWLNILVFVIFVLGYWLPYPATLARGWDSTPAHWVYFSGIAEAKDFIAQHHIQEPIYADFPQLKEGRFYNVENHTDTLKFLAFQQMPPSGGWLIYSQVFNGFSDTQLAYLKHQKPVFVSKAYPFPFLCQVKIYRLDSSWAQP